MLNSHGSLRSQSGFCSEVTRFRELIHVLSASGQRGEQMKNNIILTWEMCVPVWDGVVQMPVMGVGVEN